MMQDVYPAPTVTEVRDYCTADPGALSRAHDVVVQGLVDQFGITRAEAHHQVSTRDPAVLWPFLEAAVLAEMAARKAIVIN
jgi:hypothetical protein